MTGRPSFTLRIQEALLVHPRLTTGSPHQVWQLNETMVLRHPDGSKMSNVIYTFNFYDPWDYVTAESSPSDNDPHGLVPAVSTSTGAFFHGEGSILSYPGLYTCGIAFKGWVPLFCPRGSDQLVLVDKQWLQVESAFAN